MSGIYKWLFPAAWSAWGLYWCLAAIAAKPTRRSESPASLLSHYVPLVLAVLLLTWPRFAGTTLVRHFLPASALSFWIGAALLVTGLTFSIAARLHLGGNWSSTVTLKQNHTLTRSGPYRFVRHPIYTGLLTALLGNVVARGEWRDLLALALVFAAFRRKMQIEEQFMLQQFGDEYRRYRQEVAALIPRLL